MTQHSVWSHTSYAPLRCSYGLETEQYLSTKWCSSGGQCDMIPPSPSWVPCFSPVVGGWERLKWKLITLSDFKCMMELSSGGSAHVRFPGFVPQTQTKSIHTQPPHSSWQWPLSLLLWVCWLRANIQMPVLFYVSGYFSTLFKFLWRAGFYSYIFLFHYIN